jgi:hypothetical protein
LLLLSILIIYTASFSGLILGSDFSCFLFLSFFVRAEALPFIGSEKKRITTPDLHGSETPLPSPGLHLETD